MDSQCESFRNQIDKNDKFSYFHYWKFFLSIRSSLSVLREEFITLSSVSFAKTVIQKLYCYSKLSQLIKSKNLDTLDCYFAQLSLNRSINKSRIKSNCGSWFSNWNYIVWFSKTTRSTVIRFKFFKQWKSCLAVKVAQKRANNRSKMTRQSQKSHKVDTNHVRQETRRSLLDYAYAACPPSVRNSTSMARQGSLDDYVENTRNELLLIAKRL
ncbi:hypothetical protein P9112_003358 [Eukaryota sp. TZLM1-RC]